MTRRSPWGSVRRMASGRFQARYPSRASCISRPRRSAPSGRRRVSSPGPGLNLSAGVGRSRSRQGAARRLCVALARGASSAAPPHARALRRAPAAPRAARARIDGAEGPQTSNDPLLAREPAQGTAGVIRSARDWQDLQMPPLPYYRSDLARVHHEGFGFHADAVAPGVLKLLERSGSALGSSWRLAAGRGY